mgnify:CR=1 FL=1
MFQNNVDATIKVVAFLFLMYNVFVLIYIIQDEEMNKIPTVSEVVSSGLRIAVAVPLERSIRDVAFLSLVPILSKGWGYLGGNYGRTDMARNHIAEELLSSDYTHVLMMDSDHIHPEDLVERLARWVMADPSKKVIAGLNFRRSAPYDPCVYMDTEDGLAAPLNWPNGLGMADAVGFGCVLIEKSVFQKLNRPYFAYTYTDEGGSQSEDIYFSLQCRKMGIEIWCDTTTTSPHLTDRLIAEKDFRYYVEKHPEEVILPKDTPSQISLPNLGMDMG